eukprot:2157146-Amphidinium_carterae.1
MQDSLWSLLWLFGKDCVTLEVEALHENLGRSTKRKSKSSAAAVRGTQRTEPNLDGDTLTPTQKAQLMKLKGQG